MIEERVVRPLHQQLIEIAEELVGQPVGKVIFPPDEPAVVEQIQEIMARPGEVHRLAFRKVRKDGSIIQVAERVSVLDRDGGSGSRIHILCRDITNRIEAEQRELGLRERLALGAGRYLPKPYTLQNLADAVRSELDRNGGTIRVCSRLFMNNVSDIPEGELTL